MTEGRPVDLPNRRPAPAREIVWEGAFWRVQFGLAGDPPAVREIFIDPAGRCPVAAPVLALIHDAAVVTSHWLRAGASARAIAARLDRPHRSLLASALAAAAECERDFARPVSSKEGRS